MKSIFMPDHINVGFVERSGTYTGQLAYVIYFDEKGKLRKEKSWNSWRDHKIESQKLDNVPMSGFVLNKKAGGYDTGWNHRQTMVRMYDPRGFEFEITVENLLYILENTSSVIGKGLEGEFVYGWNSGDLVLIPSKSPDFKDLMEYNKKLKNTKKLKGTDMILGATYLDKKNEEIVYMGRFEEFSGDSYRNKDGKHHTSKGKKYFFVRLTKDGNYSNFETANSVGAKVISCVTEVPVANYASLMEKLETKCMYSPYDTTKDVFVPFTVAKLTRDLNKSKWHRDREVLINDEVYRIDEAKSHVPRYNNDWRMGYKEREELEKADRKARQELWSVVHNVLVERPRYDGQYECVEVFHGTIEQIIEKYQPSQKKGFLKNGKPYRTGVFTK